MKKLITSFLIVVSTIVLATSLTGCGVNRGDTSVKLTAASTNTSTSTILSGKDNVAILTGDDSAPTYPSDDSNSISTMSFVQSTYNSGDSEINDDTVDNSLSLSFDYNGSVPIFIDNELYGYGYLEDEYPEERIGVAFISYTTTTKGETLYHYLGNPHKHGQSEYTPIPGVDVEFVDGKFNMSFSHEKLIANTYKGEETVVEILSLDIICDAFIGYIYDEDEFNINNSTGNFNLIGLLDETHNNKLTYYAGSISLRTNDAGEFYYMELPTSYDEAANMYSFLKYDSGTNTLSYDASHLDYYYDRYLLSYYEVQEELKNADLSKLSNDLEGLELSSYHQGEITVFDGVSETLTFTYYLDYDGFNNFELIIDGETNNDFEIEIKDLEEAYVNITGLEIVNINYNYPNYHQINPTSYDNLATGVAILVFDNVNYYFDNDTNSFNGPYSYYISSEIYDEDTNELISVMRSLTPGDRNGVDYNITSKNALFVEFNFNGDFIGIECHDKYSYSSKLKEILSK